MEKIKMLIGIVLCIFCIEVNAQVEQPKRCPYCNNFVRMSVHRCTKKPKPRPIIIVSNEPEKKSLESNQLPLEISIGKGIYKVDMMSYGDCYISREFISDSLWCKLMNAKSIDSDYYPYFPIVLRDKFEDISLSLLAPHCISLSNGSQDNKINVCVWLNNASTKLRKWLTSHGEQSDKIVIDNFDANQFSFIATVDDTGSIDCPMIGSFNVRGLTIDDSEKDLLNAYKRIDKSCSFIKVDLPFKETASVIHLIVSLDHDKLLNHVMDNKKVGDNFFLIEKKLSSYILIYPDGTVNCPLIGPVKVGGMSMHERNKLLKEKYTDYFKNVAKDGVSSVEVRTYPYDILSNKKQILLRGQKNDLPNKFRIIKMRENSPQGNQMSLPFNYEMSFDQSAYYSKDFVTNAEWARTMGGASSDFPVRGKSIFEMKMFIKSLEDNYGKRVSLLVKGDNDDTVHQGDVIRLVIDYDSLQISENNYNLNNCIRENLYFNLSEDEICKVQNNHFVAFLTIDDDDNIAMPCIGMVHAGGLTTNQLYQLLSDKYTPYFRETYLPNIEISKCFVVDSSTPLVKDDINHSYGTFILKCDR